MQWQCRLKLAPVGGEEPPALPRVQPEPDVDAARATLVQQFGSKLRVCSTAIRSAPAIKLTVTSTSGEPVPRRFSTYSACVSGSIAARAARSRFAAMHRRSASGTSALSSSPCHQVERPNLPAVPERAHHLLIDRPPGADVRADEHGVGAGKNCRRPLANGYPSC